MHGRILSAIVTLSLLGTTTSAQWRENGEKIPDTEWRKRDGKFGVELAFTDKPNELFAAWEKPTAGVELSATETAVRGIPIMAVIFFTGCKPDARGMCNATVRFTSYTPDGKVWGAGQESELWVNRPAPSENEIQLSVGCMGIVIDPDEPLGLYAVEAVVTDNVAKRSMVLRRTFSAVEKQQP